MCDLGHATAEGRAKASRKLARPATPERKGGNKTITINDTAYWKGLQDLNGQILKEEAVWVGGFTKQPHIGRLRVAMAGAGIVRAIFLID